MSDADLVIDVRGLDKKFGDKVVDSSVRSRLESLRTALMTQGTSYVLQN